MDGAGLERRNPDGRDLTGSPVGDHIVISGTGRAGTTFLVQYFTAIGFDTGYGIDEALQKIDEVSSSGLERIPGGDLPYVVKSPRFTDYLIDVLADGRMKIACAIIPVRELYGAAQSRRRVYWEAGARGLDPLTHPGAIWKTNDPAEQEAALALQFYKLVETLVRYKVPMRFLAYPDFVESHDLLYAGLATLLDGHGVSKSASLQAYRRVVRLDLMHDFRR